MIINTQAPENSFKPPVDQTGDSSNLPQSPQPPPAYEPIETSRLAQTAPPVHAGNVAMFPATYRSESAATRFLKAFCIAIIVWFLMAVFMESVVDLAAGSHRRHWHGDWVSTLSLCTVMNFVFLLTTPIPLTPTDDSE